MSAQSFNSWLRTTTMRLAIRGMSLNDRLLLTDYPCWRDHVRWWIEACLDQLFGLAYKGSDQEIRSVYDGEIPPFFMSDRQRAELDQYWRDEIVANCVQPGCHWRGTLAEALDDGCPDCGEHVCIEPFEPAEDFAQEVQ